MNILDKSFYYRNPVIVAQELLGKILVKIQNEFVLSGRITETEAYCAFTDEAAHSFKGKTKRNKSLYLSAGHIYVHSIHMQNCIDIVTEDTNIPSSVLIRSLEPIEGIEQMRFYRKKNDVKDLTTGPGKICQSLQINKTLDGIDITTTDSNLYIVEDGYIPSKIINDYRIGISLNKNKKLRFYIDNNEFVSKKRN